MKKTVIKKALKMIIFHAKQEIEYLDTHEDEDIQHDEDFMIAQAVKMYLEDEGIS